MDTKSREGFTPIWERDSNFDLLKWNFPYKEDKEIRSQGVVIYRTLIGPIVFYGHETLNPRADDQCTLGVFERNVQLAKKGRLRWAGHVIRMSENNVEKMAFVKNPTGTRLCLLTTSSNMSKLGRSSWARSVNSSQNALLAIGDDSRGHPWLSLSGKVR